MRRNSKKKRGKKTLIILGVIFFILFGRFVFEAIRLSPVLFQYLFQKEVQLKKNQERINVLILGIGGGKHDGPLLTDTIIFASIDTIGKKMTLVSLPRDLWVLELRSKINTAYSSGESKRQGGGLVLTKAIVGKILDQPVDYAVRIDFNGFTKAIDMIGGLDIEVERSFEDYEYPLTGKETDTCGFEGEEFEKRATASSVLDAFPCRFEHVSFNKGTEHMNGERTLKFVRSRHAKGAEGTDFARAKRQEKVIETFKQKIFSLNTVANPARIMSLYDVVKDSIDTDIKQDEYDDFIKLAQTMRNAEVESVVFYFSDKKNGKPDLVTNPPVGPEYAGQWVIIPSAGNGNYAAIQQYIRCELARDGCDVTPTLPKTN